MFSHTLRFFRNFVPVGFCYGGFSSTAGYGPGNEAYRLSPVSGLCSFLVVPCQQVLSVFIRQPEKAFQLSREQAFRLRFRA
jgi:hypothetical protein